MFEAFLRNVVDAPAGMASSADQPALIEQPA